MYGKRRHKHCDRQNNRDGRRMVCGCTHVGVDGSFMLASGDLPDLCYCQPDAPADQHVRYAKKTAGPIPEKGIGPAVF